MQTVSIMTTKRAFLRLLVATTGLLASILELVAAAIRLGSALLERANQAVRSSQARTVVVTAPAADGWTAQRTVAPTVLMTPATFGPSPEERLHAALTGLGFRAGCVRAFTASVRGRQAPLDALIKEGIVALSATN